MIGFGGWWKGRHTIETVADVIFSPECQNRGTTVSSRIHLDKSEQSETPVMSINPYTFKTLLTPTNHIHGRRVFVFCYIHSAVGNFHLRQRIRETWGSSHNYPWTGRTVSTVFVLGTPSAQTNIMSKVQEESDTHGDILMADFEDHYDNLSHKARTTLKYAAGHYFTDYLLKADDDMFINIFRVLDLLDKYGHCLFKGLSKRILCRTWVAGPIRDKTSKFYITRQEYPNNTYPDFCAGAAVITSPDVGRALYRASFSTSTFRFDDVYVTGMLREQIGAKLVSATNQYRLLQVSDSPNFDGYNMVEKLNFVHRPNDSDYKYLWSIHKSASIRGTLITGVL